MNQTRYSPEAPAPATTSSAATRVLGGLTLAGAAAVAWLGLVATPADVVQQDAVRIAYVHVPFVATMYLPVLLCSVASAMWLWKRSDGWDALAQAGAQVGAVWVAVGLVTGGVWGKPTWGVWWTWDARLTSTLMLLLLLLGYQALRRLPDERSVRNRRAAVLGLLLVPNALIVKFSVDWWRTLHQDATIARADPQIEGLMQFTMMFGIVVGMVAMAWLMIHRFRIAWLEQRLEASSLDDAIAARRAEADGLDPVLAGGSDR